MNPYTHNSELAAIWQLGFDESDCDFGRTYDDDPESRRSVAYDEGRNGGASDALDSDCALKNLAEDSREAGQAAELKWFNEGRR